MRPGVVCPASSVCPARGREARSDRRRIERGAAQRGEGLTELAVAVWCSKSVGVLSSLLAKQCANDTGSGRWSVHRRRRRTIHTRFPHVHQQVKTELASSNPKTGPCAGEPIALRHSCSERKRNPHPKLPTRLVRQTGTPDAPFEEL